MTSPWPQNAGVDDFRVSCRVLSADGHPIQWTVTFTIAGAAAVASPSDPAASTGADSGAAEPATTGSTETTSGDDDSSSGVPLWRSAVVVMIGAAIARALRSRR